MGLTFEQKNQIIKYLAAPQNWSNIFNDKFFSDEKRRWHSERHGEVTLSVSPDSLKAHAVHEPTGASVLIDRREPGIIRITDEHDQTVTCTNGKFFTEQNMPAEIAPILSTAEFGFNDKKSTTLIQSSMNIILRFDKDGSKTVFFDDLGQKISYPAPDKPIEREIQPGTFFQRISFPTAAAKEWDMHPLSLLHNAKLIVAKDMDVEPNLRAVNELDQRKAEEMLLAFLQTEYDKNWTGPEAWRPQIKKKMGDLSQAEKVWLDTTDFTGNIIDLPQRFFVSTTHDGFDLTTSSDMKHAIRSHGDVLIQARELDLSPVRTINTKTKVQSLLHILEHGTTVTDHLNQEWNVSVLQSPHTKEIAKKTKSCMRDQMGLTNMEYAVLNYEENRCLLAMESKTLERITRADRASHHAVELIMIKSKDTNTLLKCLQDGADYKYINHEETQRGKTFADLMIKHEAYELLEALKSVQGLHKIETPDEESSSPAPEL